VERSGRPGHRIAAEIDLCRIPSQQRIVPLAYSARRSDWRICSKPESSWAGPDRRRSGALTRFGETRCWWRRQSCEEPGRSHHCYARGTPLPKIRISTAMLELILTGLTERGYQCVVPRPEQLRLAPPEMKR
jgi:hypothetical protein